MDFSSDVVQAFTNFKSDPSLLALPLDLSNTTLQALPPVSLPTDPEHPFQQALNRLNTVLSPKHALYLILRRNGSLIAITYVPYLANTETKNLLLENRNELVQKLGHENFSSAIICKEKAEISDARSWDERDGQGKSWGEEKNSEETQSCEPHDAEDAEGGGVKDLGYKKNRCRLCDRRMTNKINDNALEALKILDEAGACVQLSVNITTESLQLNFHTPSLPPTTIASKLPTNRPSYTFYRHPSNHVLYFIFCSPDSASVQERMKHTMAIPGLINIIAKDNGVQVDQKIEIHEAEELEFGEKDTRIGLFRSMYLRNEFEGTESNWEGMEVQQGILDAVR